MASSPENRESKDEQKESDDDWAIPAIGKKHPVIATRWFSRVQGGDCSSVTRQELHELFRAVDASSDGSIMVKDLQSTVTRVCPRAVSRLLKTAIMLAEPLKEGSISVEQLLQAMRLGNEESALAFAARLHGCANHQHGLVDRDELVKVLRHRKKVWDDCMSLPFTLVLFVVFCTAVILHLKQQTFYRLTEAVSRDLPLVQLEASYPGSLLSWLDTRIASPYVAHYNRLLDGVQIVRGIGNSEPALSALCSYTVADYLGDAVLPGRSAEPSTCSPSSPNDLEWMLWPVGRSDSEAVIARLRGWWTFMGDESVPASGPEHVEVRMLAYNSNLNFFVLERLSFHTTSSGGVQFTALGTAFDANPVWHDTQSHQSGERIALMVLDTIFLFMCFLLFCQLIGQAVTRCRRAGCRRTAQGGADVWVWIGIDILIVLLASFATLVYSYCNHLTALLLQNKDRLPSIDPASSSLPYSDASLAVYVSSTASMSLAEYQQQLSIVLDIAALLADGQEYIRWCIAAITFCVCFRFFKAFRANPSLNILLAVLRTVAVDIGHFVVIFGSLFVVFAVLGHMIFGTGVDMFSTIPKALHTSLLLLMGFVLDEYKDKMFDEGGALAVLWVLTFTGIMVLLLFSMFLAAVHEIYRETKRAQPAGMSILQQVGEMISDRRQLKQRLSAAAAQPDVTHSDSMWAESGAPPPRPRRRLAPSWSQGWNEGRLLRALASQDGPKLITADSVCETLGVTGADERLQLSALVEHLTSCETPPPSAPVTPLDAARLCGRIDANTRDIEPLLDKLEGWAQHCLEERAELMAAHVEGRPASRPFCHSRLSYNSARGSAAQDVLRVEDIDDIEPGRPPPPPFAESPDPSRRSSPDVRRASPEAWQQAARSAWATNVDVDALLEERLARVAEAQEQRHQVLEDAIKRLAGKLEPMLQSRTPDSAVDPSRLARLESTVRTLTARLEPILEQDREMMEVASQKMVAIKRMGF